MASNDTRSTVLGLSSDLWSVRSVTDVIIVWAAPINGSYMALVITEANDDGESAIPRLDD